MKKKLYLLMGLLFVAAAAAGCNRSEESQKDQFPNKQIEIVVPFDAGGASDLSIRTIAPYLEKELGQPVMVSNVAGANGLTGTQQVVNSAPDGYSLVWISTRPNLPEMYSPEPPYTSKDLRPVAECVETAGAIVVNADSDFNTVEDLIRHIRENPGIKYGHSGRGNKNHMTSVVLAGTYGLEMSDVPYSGDNDAITALLRKDVDFIFAGCMPSIPHVEAGKLRILAVLNEDRVNALPDIPTLKETEYPLDNIISYIGIFAPSGTPDEVVLKIEKAVCKAMENEELKQSLTELGLVPSYRSGEDFKEVIDGYFERISPLVKELGLYEN